MEGNDTLFTMVFLICCFSFYVSKVKNKGSFGIYCTKPKIDYKYIH